MKKMATIATLVVVLLALSGCSAESKDKHLTPKDVFVDLPNEVPQLIEYNCDGWDFLYLIPTICDINIEELCGELTEYGFEYEVEEDSTETKIYIKNITQK